MAPSRSELPQGTLDLLILTTVSDNPRHGYAIAQRLRQISSDVIQVRQGSLYPALHRLERRGLLAQEWRTSETGREAKYYRLTTKGRAQLESDRSDWRRLARAIGLILRSAGEETS
jgi:PadR family transcriptional regulator PadR